MPNPRSSGAFLLILAAGMAGTATAAQKPRVMVLEQRRVELPVSFGERPLQRAAEEGVRTEEAVVVNPGEAVTCADGPCRRAAAAKAGATYLLLLDGAYDAVGANPSFAFNLTAELVNLEGATVIKERSPDCDPCTGPMVLERVRAVARSVIARAVTEPVAPPIQPPQPAAPLALDDGAGLPSARPARFWSGVALAGVGLATAVGGGVLWSMDGDGKDCLGQTCRNRYDTRNLGISIMVAGLVGAGVGGWLLYDSTTREKSVSVFLMPMGVRLAGRF